MHLVQCPTGDYFTVFKTCPPHLGFLVKIKHRQLHACWFLNGSSNPPCPCMSNSLFSPLDLCEHKQWQQPLQFQWNCTGLPLLRTWPSGPYLRKQKEGRTAGFSQPSLAWLHFFSSVWLSGPEDLLPAWLDRVFQVCRTQLQQALTTAVCSAPWCSGPAWGKQHLLIPTNPYRNSASPMWPYKSASLSFLLKAIN